MSLAILSLSFFIAVVSAVIPNFPPVACDRGKNCLNCHPDRDQGSIKHIGIDNNNCAYCHDEGNISIAPGDDIINAGHGCTDCHPLSDRFGVSHVHETISCLECHNPHSSDFGNLLRKSSAILCSGSCHGFEELGNSHPVGSSYVDTNTGSELTCTTTCHRVHRPESEKLLSVASPDLCFKCHPDKF